MIVVYLLILLIVVCLILTAIQYRRENFSMPDVNKYIPNDPISTVSRVNREVENVAKFWNGIVQDWYPNVGWIYRYRDKSIELERAKHGLPPLQAAMPEVKVNVSANNNRYSTGFRA